MNPMRRLVFTFVGMGLLFSGYLSAVKLFTDTCAFNESCPYFLGYPACWYGFAMYSAMFILLMLGTRGILSQSNMFKSIVGVSLAGTIFSGSFVIQELSRSTITGLLGLSTCAYGLIFYILILSVSFLGYLRSRRQLPR